MYFRFAPHQIATNPSDDMPPLHKHIHFSPTASQAVRQDAAYLLITLLFHQLLPTDCIRDPSGFPFQVGFIIGTAVRTLTAPSRPLFFPTSCVGAIGFPIQWSPLICKNTAVILPSIPKWCQQVRWRPYCGSRCITFMIKPAVRPRSFGHFCYN